LVLNKTRPKTRVRKKINEISIAFVKPSFIRNFPSSMFDAAVA
jgi:hypothetical protein